MANTKISQLPTWTGTNADIRWFVMNNDGETETYKFSGYSAQLIVGTGTGSFRTPTQTASGTNSIAIGTGASATGNNSVCIGDLAGQTVSNNSISIGKHAQSIGDNIIVIGATSYTNGAYGIAIGTDTASNNAGIVIGSNASRATAIHSITLGNNNQRNIGGYSSILGYNNKIADAPNFSPGNYNNIIASNSTINGTSALYGNNNIFGGNNNTITGTTSGATLLGLSNYNATRSDATFAMAYVMTEWASYNFANDSDAAAGGVVLGQMYHTAGVLKIRIT
jgi:hypothetical protein